MKRFLVVLGLLMLAALAMGDVVVVSTSGGEVAFTNTQPRFVWTPTAVVYSRTDAVPVTVTITRHGSGQPVLLSSVSATTSNLIWAPTARYIFDYGSSLVVSSSVAAFSIQLHREPAHD
jgi:hypothetical protein